MLRIEDRWKDKPEARYLAKLVAMAEMELPVTGEHSLQEFLDAIKKLHAQHLEQRVEHFEQKDRTDGLTEDEIIEYNQLLIGK